MRFLNRLIILSITVLVITAWALSFLGILKWWNYRWIVFLGILTTLLFLWKKKDRLKPIFSKLIHDLKGPKGIRDYLVLATLLIWIIFIVYALIKIVLFPSWNWDSLTYHLTKIALGHQNGTMWFDPSIPVERVNFSQSNSEILNLAFFSIFGRDYLVELPQLLSAILIPVYLVKISIDFVKVEKQKAIIATLSLLTIPLYWMQATTTQNDLLFVLFILIAIYNFLLFFKRSKRTNFVFLLLSIAILVGTKYHGILFGAFFGLAIFVVLVRKKILPRYIKISLLLSPILVILALPNFLIAQIYYGSFLFQKVPNFKIGLETVKANLKHFSEWFYSLPGYDVYYFSHDVSHMGYLFMFIIPLGLVFLIIELFKYFKVKLNKLMLKTYLSDKLGYIAVVAILIVFTIIFIFMHYPDPWDLRLIFIIPILITFYVSLRLIKYRKRALIGFSVVSLILIAVHFFSYIKWELPKFNNAIGIAREEKRIMNLGEYADYLKIVDLFLEDSDHKSNEVLYCGSSDSWVYPWWGKSWQNELFFPKCEDFDEVREYADDYDYFIFMSDKLFKQDVEIPENWKLLFEQNDRYIYKNHGANDNSSTISEKHSKG